jgi:hypothetical protein
MVLCDAKPMDSPLITEAIERLKAVFAEVPGTQLSLAEASRLSGSNRHDANRFSTRSSVQAS